MRARVSPLESYFIVLIRVISYLFCRIKLYNMLSPTDKTLPFLRNDSNVPQRVLAHLSLGYRANFDNVSPLKISKKIV